jgi:hypothetical protein
MSNIAEHDPADRWRHFAIAACGGAANGVQGVALYVERLRTRESLFPIHNYGRKVWLHRSRRCRFAAGHGMQIVAHDRSTYSPQEVRRGVRNSSPCFRRNRDGGFCNTQSIPCVHAVSSH